MQMMHTRTAMPKVTWSESDPVLDEDLLEDDQPGGQDLTRTPVVTPNVTEFQVAEVQASVSHSQDPNSTSTAKADQGAAAATNVSGTQALETNETDASAATTGANISSEISNATTNATNASEATTNVSDVHVGCATRADDRIQSWFASAAAPGSPCIFGIDVRDENSHCIYEDGAYGSFGWCFTASDRSEWGACNERCPLYGAPSALGKKIDSVAAKIDKVVEKLSPGSKSEEGEKKKPSSEGLATLKTDAIPGALETEKDAGAPGAAKGKRKGKDVEASEGAKDKGKGEGKHKDNNQE